MAEKLAFILSFLMILSCAGCADDPLLRELGLGGNRDDGCDGSCKRKPVAPDREPAPQPKRPSPCPGPNCPRPYQPGAAK